MFEYNFYYAIAPEARLAVDENGNWVETYLELTMGRKNKMVGNDYARAQEELIQFVAKNLDIGPEMVRPMSAEEYFAKVGNVE